MKGFRNKNLSVISFLFYLKDAKAFTQNWLCYMCVSGEHMELYTKNFHELPGAEIELRGNIVLLKFIIALLATNKNHQKSWRKEKQFICVFKNIEYYQAGYVW